MPLLVEGLDAGERRRGCAPATRAAPSLPITFFQAFSSISIASTKAKPTSLRNSASVDIFSCTAAAACSRRGSVAPGRSLAAPGTRPAAWRAARRSARVCSARSSSESFCSSKTAGDFETRSSEKLLDQLLDREEGRRLVEAPAEQREVVDAPPRAGSRRRAAPGRRRRRGASTAACRRCRAAAAGARSSGGCAPSACITSSWRGVLERWSSPRTTCGDLHVGVVDRDREVVERRAIRRARSRSRRAGGSRSSTRRGSRRARRSRPRRARAAGRPRRARPRRPACPGSPRRPAPALACLTSSAVAVSQ